MSKKLPKSIRKHIRKQKAQIARKFTDEEAQKEAINQLYESFARPLNNTKTEGAPVKEEKKSAETKKEKAPKKVEKKKPAKTKDAKTTTKKK